MKLLLIGSGSIQTGLSCAALGSSLLGAALDLHSRRIPNWLTGPTLLVGLGLQILAGGWSSVGASVLAMLAAGGVFLVFYVAGGMGAGDVKMMAAQGCLFGFAGLPLLLSTTAIAGGVLAVAVALVHGRLRETVQNTLALSAHHIQNGIAPHAELNVDNPVQLRLPYGVAIAAGVMLTLFIQHVQG